MMISRIKTGGRFRMLTALKEHRRIAVVICTLLFMSAEIATAQNPGPDRRIMLPARQREVPAATLSCSAEESKWWEELRQAGKAVQNSRGGKKELERFLKLLQD